MTGLQTPGIVLSLMREVSVPQIVVCMCSNLKHYFSRNHAAVTRRATAGPREEPSAQNNVLLFLGRHLAVWANTIGADKTVFPQHPGNPLRSSQCNGTAHAAEIGTESTPALEVNRSRPWTTPKTRSKRVKWQAAVRLCTAFTLVHAVGMWEQGGGAHSTDGGVGGISST